MSFIYRDFLTPSRFEWNRASALYHKFDKVWPKTTVDGVQVYAKRMTYWDGQVRSDVRFKRFVSALGVEYAQLENAVYEGVTKVYFKLTPGKYKYRAPEKAAIVADLASVFNVGDEFELYIHYSGETRRVVESHWKLKSGAIGDKIKDYTIDTVGIRNTLHSDPMLYFANARLISAGTLVPYANPALRVLLQTAQRTSPRSTPVTRVEYDEDVTHIYATLALLDNGTTFQQVGEIYDERTTVTKTSVSDVYFDYSYKIKFKVIAAPTIDSYIVEQVDLLSNTMESALGYKGGDIYARSNAAADTTLKEAVIEMNNVEAIGLTYNGQLRVDAVAMMKRKEFATMLGKIFGTGYKKKKAKWYEKVIAVVLVVIAVVIGVASGGGLAAVSSSLVAAATALATAGLVLSLGMMLYASAFPNATDQTRMIGKFAQIVGLAAMVTGVMAAIQASWQRMVAQETAKQMATGATEQQAAAYVAANVGVKEYALYLLEGIRNSAYGAFNNVVNTATTLTTPGQWSLPSLTDVGGWMRNIGEGLKMYTKFFGEQKQYSTMAEDEQATKEDGVESVFLAYEMVDNVDALYRMDNMVRNNLGGQKTENFLTQIA